MPLDFTPISQLIPTDEPCKIKVRIARLWGFEKPERPGVITGLDMILVDDKGDRIQASVSQGLLQKYQKELDEGACRVIMNFKLLHNQGSFKGSSHPYKINFLFTTYVKDSEDIPNLSHRFYFHPFPQIGSESHDADVFFDVIGEIIGMSELQDVRVGSRTEKLLQIQLRDLGETIIDCTLWSKFAVEAHSYVKSNNDGPVVLLGSLMKTKKFNGKITIQNNPFASKLFFTTDINEIKEFKDRLCNNDSQIYVSQLTSSSSSSQNTQDAFPISSYKTVAQIVGESEEMICVTLASIVSIHSEIPWSYIGCTSCFKKATRYFNPLTEEVELGKYSCQHCKKQLTTTSIRYMVKVKAADQTGTATFVLFDREVIDLIHKSAYEIRQQQIEFNRQDDFPQELLDLEGRLVVLKVKLTGSDQSYSNFSFQVAKLTVDPSEIQKFKDVSNHAAISLSSHLSTESTIQIENTSSETNDNELLANPFNPIRKRPLSVVIDDEPAQESSTKHNSPPSLNKPKGSSKVFVKKEKKK